MLLRPFLILLALSFLLLSWNEIQAHGGRFKPPTPGVTPGDPGESSGTGSSKMKGFSFPGGGPQFAFSENRWEFWWDFHHEPLLDLRKALFSRTAAAGVIDFPFETISVDEKRINLVRPLTGMIRERHSGVRSAAVVALARTRDENIIPYLEHAYEKDDNLNVRTMAILSLGISKNPRAVKLLHSVMKNERESDEIRFFATISLGFIGGENTTTVFKNYLDPPTFNRLDRNIQRAVAFASGLTNDPTLAPLVQRLLINKVSGDDVTDSFLVLSLGRLGDWSANALLINFLEKGHFQSRRSSAIALGVAATPADKDVITALGRAVMSDADLMVKNFCYIALGRIGGTEAEKILLKQFNSVTQTKLPFVAIALGLLGSSENGALLLQRFKSLKDLSTRAALAVSLGLLRYTPALGDLRKAMDRESEPVFRSYCAQALGMLRDVESIDRLRDACTDSNDVELIRSAAIALGLIGDHGAVKVLHDLIRKGKKSDVVNSAAAYAMGMIGDKKAIQHLVSIVENENLTAELRSYGVISLGLLGDNSPFPIISAVTRNSNYTIMETYLYEIFNVN